MQPVIDATDRDLPSARKSTPRLLRSVSAPRNWPFWKRSLQSFFLRTGAYGLRIARSCSRLVRCKGRVREPGKGRVRMRQKLKASQLENFNVRKVPAMVGTQTRLLCSRTDGHMQFPDRMLLRAAAVRRECQGCRFLLLMGSRFHGRIWGRKG